MVTGNEKLNVSENSVKENAPLELMGTLYEVSKLPTKSARDIAMAQITSHAVEVLRTLQVLTTA